MKIFSCPKQIRFVAHTIVILAVGQTLLSQNVLLFTIDSCRSDRFGIYGYSGNTTPNIDAWAKTGTVFQNTYSTSAWTAPGLVSILSGLYPPTHEVNNRDRIGSPDLITLPKIFKKYGYEIPNLNFFTFAPYYVNLGLPSVDRTYFGKNDGDEILNWLDQNLKNKKTQPFFVFYHSTIVHQPYKPASENLPLPLEELEKRPAIKAILNGAIVPIGSTTFDENDQVILDLLYDAEIRKLDRLFGSILELLENKKVLENTLIVLTADHGEELLDHGFVGHASTSLSAKLYEEFIRIPLILSWPGHVPANKIDKRLASQIDIVPTVLPILGLKPPKTVEGINLLNPHPVDRSLYFESVIAGNQTTKQNEGIWIRAVRKGRHKFITTEELYDLQLDPGETKNLAGIYPELTIQLRKKIDRWVHHSSLKARKLFQKSSQIYTFEKKDTKCPEIQMPLDNSVLSYDRHTGVVLLRWRGDLATEYLVQYDIGTGDHHVSGILPVHGNHQLLGPFTQELWGNLKAWNPFKIRVAAKELKTCWSKWVTFEF